MEKRPKSKGIPFKTPKSIGYRTLLVLNRALNKTLYCLGYCAFLEWIAIVPSYKSFGPNIFFFLFVFVVLPCQCWPGKDTSYRELGTSGEPGQRCPRIKYYKIVITSSNNKLKIKQNVYYICFLLLKGIPLDIVCFFAF